MTTTTRLAIVCDLRDYQRWADEYIASRGDADSQQLIRKLVLGDFLEYLQQRQQRTETTNEKQGNAIDQRV